jgi:diacylglycerol kinase family enzyme
VELRGRARSIVLANSPSTGALVPIGDVTPEDPYLELTVYPAGRGAGLLRRFAAAVMPGLERRLPSWRVRQVRIETSPDVNAYADAALAGRTPVTAEVDRDGLQVIVPRR